MFEILFFFLTLIAVGLIVVALLKASNPLLALGGTLLLIIGLLVYTTGYEQPNRIMTYDANSSSTQIDIQYVPYMPLVETYPAVWIIATVYFYGGIACLGFVFVNFLYIRWIKRMIERGI